MTVLGVTGCVGAGKSTACAQLRQLGWAVFDVDAEAALLVPPLSGALRRVLGADASVTPSAVLGALVTKPAQRPAIEAMLVPAVMARLHEWRAALSGPGVIDSALLFEFGLDALCDATLCITCEVALRRQRVTSRATASASLFEAIEAAQWSEVAKAAKATHRLSSQVAPEAFHASVRALAARVA